MEPFYAARKVLTAHQVREVVAAAHQMVGTSASARLVGRLGRLKWWGG
ncbi:hypothetical protein ACFOLD_13780 [Kocuria carniphila]